jgi:hypothetical protein
MHYPPELPALNVTWEHEQATTIIHRYCRAGLTLGLSRIATLLRAAPIAAEECDELLSCLAHARHHAERDMCRYQADIVGRLQ